MDWTAWHRDGSGAARSHAAAGPATSRAALTQLRALTGLRLALIVAAAALVVWRPQAFAVESGSVVLALAGYSTFVLVITVLQRWWPSAATVTVLLLVDAVALVALIAVTGGATSPLVFVALLHLVAVARLVSPGTAVRLGAWYALLLLGAKHFVDDGTLGQPAQPLTLSFAATALLFVAFGIGCAFVAVADDRARVHAHDYFRQLADLSTDLEREATADGVMVALGRHFHVDLNFDRVAVLSTPIAGGREVRGAIYHPTAADDDGAFLFATTPAGTESTTIEALAEDGVRLHRVREPELTELVDTFVPLAANVMVLPLMAGGEISGVVLAEWDAARSSRLPLDIYDAAVQAASHASLVLRNTRLRAEIEQLATRDPLTGLPNRRVLAGALERELARARRYGTPLGLVMLDLDHFKNVNDQHGHAVGDRVLREVSRGLLDAARGEDLVARYGGEEFVVLLPGVDTDTLGQAADRIRELAGAASVTQPVTLSAGAACFPFDATDESALFEAADLALYRAKRAGRNRTHVSAAARSRQGGGREQTPHEPLRVSG